LKARNTNRNLPFPIGVDKLCDFKRVIFQLSSRFTREISFSLALPTCHWQRNEMKRHVRLWLEQKLNVSQTSEVLNGLKFDNDSSDSKSEKLLSRIYQGTRAINADLFRSFTVLSYRLIPLFIECTKCSFADNQVTQKLC
jgi:hypothetical protein